MIPDGFAARCIPEADDERLAAAPDRDDELLEDDDPGELGEGRRIPD
jgi:hypothetical protein